MQVPLARPVADPVTVSRVMMVEPLLTGAASLQLFEPRAQIVQQSLLLLNGRLLRLHRAGELVNRAR